MPDSRTVRSTMRTRRRARAVEPEVALTYAFAVISRILRLSWRFGTTRPPRLHGVMTATGSGSSMVSHTRGSWALSDPWCGTLNADAFAERPRGILNDRRPAAPLEVGTQQHGDVANGYPEHDGGVIG